MFFKEHSKLTKSETKREQINQITIVCPRYYANCQLNNINQFYAFVAFPNLLKLPLNRLVKK